MAKFIKDTAINSALPIGFNRGNPQPIDSSSVFATLTEATTYAASSAIAYVGQIIAVSENGNAYIITDEAGTLKEIGAAKNLTQDEILDALGFDDAAAGAQLVKGTDGNLSWVVPSTETVEGLQTTVESIKTDISGLEGRVATLEGDSSTEGSVAYQIAQVVAGADENYDTLKEIADWIKSDSTGAAKMANDITDLQSKVGDSSVADQITAALKDGESDKYALASDLATTDGKVTALETLVGDTSVSDQLAEALQDALKVNTAEDGEEPVYEDKYTLKDHTHTISDVTGLQAALNNKADTSVTDDLASRLDTLETPADNAEVLAAITQEKVEDWDAAEANVIESISVDGTALTISNKKVALPILTEAQFGLVKVDNTSIEQTAGVIGVKAVHISKLYMNEDDELILNGGQA